MPTRKKTFIQPSTSSAATPLGPCGPTASPSACWAASAGSTRGECGLATRPVPGRGPRIVPTGNLRRRWRTAIGMTPRPGVIWVSVWFSRTLRGMEMPEATSKKHDKYSLGSTDVDGNWGEWTPFTECPFSCLPTEGAVIPDSIRVRACNNPAPMVT